MEALANSIPVGSDGISIIPFGNGAERMLGNTETGSYICNLNFNRHDRAHLYRAALEGIAFSFAYGIDILRELGVGPEMMRVGNDNLFRSAIFGQTISNLAGCQIEVINMTGAVGAARAAGIALGHFNSLEEAMQADAVVFEYIPERKTEGTQRAYRIWKQELEKIKS